MSNWINNLFGVSLSPTLSFILLFAAIIVGLMLLIWIARRLLGGTFVSGGRGRHLRLAVMDATPVDSRRRLVLVRRDDVEHLILIGGPTDLVVEQNIRIDGPREARNIQAPSEPAIQEPVVQAPVMQQSPVEMPRPAEAPRIEPSRQAAPLPPLQPRPAPQTPTAPYLPPRSVLPPREDLPARSPMPVREAISPARPFTPPASPVTEPAAPAITSPRPFAPTPRIEPAAAALASRPEPAPAVAPVPVVTVRPVAATKTADQDMDDSLLADLTESMSFDDEEISPEVSLEKEMQSLLGTLDTKKDRIS